MNLYRTYANYVSLNVLSMAGLSLYILADTFFIANGVGTQGLTALGLALPLYSLVNGLGLMLGVGGATRFSIARGEGSEALARKMLSSALMPGLIVGLLLAVGGVLSAQPLMRLLGASPAVQPYGADYLRTLLLFSPFFILNNILVAFVRNDGAPHTAMAAMLTASAANIVLDWFFIYPLGWGMAGAALATGLAPILSMCVLLPRLLSKRSTLRLTRVVLKKGMLHRILEAGLSAFVTEVSTGLLMMLFNFTILRLLGDAGVGAYSVIINISLVCMAMFTGVAQGVQPLLSVRAGAGDSHGMRRLLKCALGTAAVFGLLFYAVLVPARQGVVRLFNSAGDALLQQAAVSGIPLYFLCFPLMGINVAASAGLASTGRGRAALLLSLGRGLLLPAALLLLLAALFGMPGVWLAVPAAEGLGALLALLLLRRGVSMQLDS